MKTYHFPAAKLHTYRHADPTKKATPCTVPLWCPAISTPISRAEAAAALRSLRRRRSLCTIRPDSLCVGQTEDKRAVWQNKDGPAFCVVHDAAQRPHYLADVTEYTPHAKPYTRASLDA